MADLSVVVLVVAIVEFSLTVLQPHMSQSDVALTTELTFVSLQVVEDLVDGRHGAVHQFVQLEGGGAGGLCQVLQPGPAPLCLPPRCPRSQARLPVGRAEREEVVYPGLHPVPLRRQVVHLVPVDLPGGDQLGAEQEQQQHHQQRRPGVSGTEIIEFSV